MSKNPKSIPHRETNNHPQGRSGSGTMKMSGPAAGKGDLGKKGNKGGVFRPTKGKM